MKKISNDRFIELMADYDNLTKNIAEGLAGNDEEVIFAAIALFTLEWKYNVELFYSCAAEAEEHRVSEIPIERLGLL